MLRRHTARCQVVVVWTCWRRSVERDGQELVDWQPCHLPAELHRQSWHMQAYVCMHCNIPDLPKQTLTHFCLLLFFHKQYTLGKLSNSYSDARFHTAIPSVNKYNTNIITQLSINFTMIKTVHLWNKFTVLICTSVLCSSFFVFISCFIH